MKLTIKLSILIITLLLKLSLYPLVSLKRTRRHGKLFGLLLIEDGPRLLTPLLKKILWLYPFVGGANLKSIDTQLSSPTMGQNR